MKTFEDLEFKRHPLAGGDTEAITSISNGKLLKAVMNFDNGYGVSVLFGSLFYSNAIDTYEVGILQDGGLTHETPITDDVIGYATKEKVTDIMKQVQELDNDEMD